VCGECNLQTSTESYAGHLELHELAMIVAPRGEPEPKPTPSCVVFGLDSVKKLDVSSYASAVEANEFARAGFHTEIYVMAILLGLRDLCT
jgi:hypothetical protein